MRGAEDGDTRAVIAAQGDGKYLPDARKRKEHLALMTDAVKRNLAVSARMDEISLWFVGEYGRRHRQQDGR